MQIGQTKITTPYKDIITTNKPRLTKDLRKAILWLNPKWGCPMYAFDIHMPFQPYNIRKFKDV